MSTDKKLTQKEKELVAVAASIASGCLPCTTQHIKLARETGAADGEVLRSIYIALDVRDNATEIMAETALGNPVNEYPMRELSGSIGQPVDDLISMGAALACNSVAGLEYHMWKARMAGASPRQIQTVMGIARAIRKEAEEKTGAIIGNVIELNQVETVDQPGGCCHRAEHSQSKHLDKDIT
jgi:AhpD family alkylhydroperoxidase